MHMIEHARFLHRDSAEQINQFSQKKLSIKHRLHRLKDLLPLKSKSHTHHKKAHQELFVQLPLALTYSQFSTEPIRLPRSPLGSIIIFQKEQQGTMDGAKTLMKFGDILAGPPPESFHPPGLPEKRSTCTAAQLPLPYLHHSLLPKRI
ncbi:MAG: hypothetical protein RLZZ455_1139 [Candidatus Parcubacteria bacterium]